MHRLRLALEARVSGLVLLRQTSEGALEPAFYEQKVKTARFFMTKLLPQVQALAASIKAGAAPVMEPVLEFEEALATA